MSKSKPCKKSYCRKSKSRKTVRCRADEHRVRGQCRKNKSRSKTRRITEGQRRRERAVVKAFEKRQALGLPPFVMKYGKKTTKTTNSIQLTGYSGLFRARILNADGTNIVDQNGVPIYTYTSFDNYLYTTLVKNYVASQNNWTDEEFENEVFALYLSIIEGINDEMNNKYFSGYENNDPFGKPYGFVKYGFGGDESDGLLYFFCKEKVLLPQPLKFDVLKKPYLMNWYYVGDE
jgi:hypothetical protein